MARIEAFEGWQYPIESPSPASAIKFRMEQGGMSLGDMAPYIGPLSLVCGVLDGVMPVTAPMAKRLATLGTPADVLVPAQQ